MVVPLLAIPPPAKIAKLLALPSEIAPAARAGDTLATRKEAIRAVRALKITMEQIFRAMKLFIPSL